MSKNKYSLHIGLNDYPGTGLDLNGCVNDAMDFWDLLLYKEFSARTLLNSAATKENITRYISEILGWAKSGDTVFISFSGHGSFVADTSGDELDGTDEVLCPYDILQGNYITDDELYSLFSKRKRGVKLIFLSDSCHSGSVNRFAALNDTVEARSINFDKPILKRFMPPSIFSEGKLLPRQKNAMAMPSRPFPGILLSGCKDNEYSYDAFFNGRPNGAFSYYALQALGALPENASYTKWYNEIRKHLPADYYPQTPQLSGSKYQKGWKVL